MENQAQTAIDGMSATYSVEDNKLRLYATSRLDADTYQRVKTAGFKWAPKQDLFVAPKWTPQREDLCIELAGEIEPEATTLVERAQAKADRLDAIAENKERKANAFHRVADDLSRAFEFGQPILVGHHSERKARKTQAQMHSNMRKAAENFNSISYWQYRAEGVECHANRKNNPKVRARRIKTLLTELRDIQRDLNTAALRLTLWEKVEGDEQIKFLAGRVSVNWDSWSQLDKGEISPADYRVKSIEGLKAVISSLYRKRWIDHILNRLAYERDMLGDVKRFEGELTPPMLQIFTREHGTHKPKATKLEQGRFKLESSAPLPLHLCVGSSLDLSSDEWRDLMQAVGYEVPDKKPAKPSILNFKAEVFKSENRWNAGQFQTFEQIQMTKAEYANINSDHRGTRFSECKTFRFKTCINPFHSGPRHLAEHVAVFLIDSKVHEVPASMETC